MKLFKKNSAHVYPGVQRPIWRFNSLMFFLVGLTIIFFLLTIYSSIQENLILFSADHWVRRFVSYEILDTKTSCTIFISLLGLILIRHHFILGFKPRLIYESEKILDQTSKTESWEVKIRNVGLGAAVIADYKFRLSMDNANDAKDYTLDFQQVKNILEAKNIYLDKDFSLTNITKGYTLTSKEEKVIFKIVLPKAFIIKQLDIKLIFVGFIGGKYRKEVFLIPRKGIFKTPVLELHN